MDLRKSNTVNLRLFLVPSESSSLTNLVFCLSIFAGTRVSHRDENAFMAHGRSLAAVNTALVHPL